MQLLELALYYAEVRGWPVFPCNGKVPYTRTGFKAATKDPEQIRAWWQRWPSAAIGIPTGEASGFVVVDVDGQQGYHALKVNGYELPETYTVRTRKGAHYYYKWPGHRVPNFTRGLPDVDFRGDGGYVIAAGSPHPDGGAYEADDTEAEVHGPMPNWCESIRSQIGDTGLAKTKVRDLKEFPEGERNASLFRVASAYRAQGFSEDQIFALISVDNQNKCKPPLPHKELQQIAESVMRYTPDDAASMLLTPHDWMTSNEKLVEKLAEEGVIDGNVETKIKENIQKLAEAKGASDVSLAISVQRLTNGPGRGSSFNASVKYDSIEIHLFDIKPEEILSWMKFRALCLHEGLFIENDKKIITAYNRVIKQAMLSCEVIDRGEDDDIIGAIMECMRDWVNTRNRVTKIEEVVAVNGSNVMAKGPGFVFQSSKMRDYVKSNIREAKREDITKARDLMGMRKTTVSGRSVWYYEEAKDEYAKIKKGEQL